MMGLHKQATNVHLAHGLVNVETQYTRQPCVFMAVTDETLYAPN